MTQYQYRNRDGGRYWTTVPPEVMENYSSITWTGKTRPKVEPAADTGTLITTNHP